MLGCSSSTTMVWILLAAKRNLGEGLRSGAQVNLSASQRDFTSRLMGKDFHLLLEVHFLSIGSPFHPRRGLHRDGTFLTRFLCQSLSLRLRLPP